jgi:hypothetical protein
VRVIVLSVSPAANVSSAGSIVTVVIAVYVC